MNMINVPSFPLLQCFLKIDGNASLSKPNIEAGERENLFSGEFKADFSQTFNARIVWIFKKVEQGFPLHLSLSFLFVCLKNTTFKAYSLTTDCHLLLRTPKWSPKCGGYIYQEWKVGRGSAKEKEVCELLLERPIICSSQLNHLFEL